LHAEIFFIELAENLVLLDCLLKV